LVVVERHLVEFQLMLDVSVPVDTGHVAELTDLRGDVETAESTPTLS
jgi:hypothetical protein